MAMSKFRNVLVILCAFVFCGISNAQEETASRSPFFGQGMAFS